jgi:hypothetical protein
MRSSTMAAIAFIVFTVSTSTAFAGLHGQQWYAAEGYLQVHGRSRTTTGSPMFCSKWLWCSVSQGSSSKPDYYLLECRRDRGICEGTLAVILPPGGEPWLTPIEFRIISWTPQRIIANPAPPWLGCISKTLQIDLDSKEVIFTETITKADKSDPICLPENIGYTETYKLEDY